MARKHRTLRPEPSKARPERVPIGKHRNRPQYRAVSVYSHRNTRNGRK